MGLVENFAKKAGRSFSWTLQGMTRVMPLARAIPFAPAAKTWSYTTLELDIGIRRADAPLEAISVSKTSSAASISLVL